MYDELVKRLRKTSCGAKDTSWWQAADAIEELSGFVQEAERDRDEYKERLDKTNDLMQKQWIPVTERLPKMTDGENISKEVYVTDGTEIAKACIMRDYDGVASWTYTGIGKITHWCEQIPLPQPPKE